MPTYVAEVIGTLGSLLAVLSVDGIRDMVQGSCMRSSLAVAARTGAPVPPARAREMSSIGVSHVRLLDDRPSVCYTKNTNSLRISTELQDGYILTNYTPRIPDGLCDELHSRERSEVV